MIKRPDDMHNTITLDQEAAESVGRQTRVPYLLLGPMHDGLSSNRKGVSLPGNTSRPAVFNRLFINGSPDEVAREVRRVQDGQSILDGTRDQLKALERMTGAADRRRLDILASSIREAEKSLAQDEEWATKPKPKVDEKLEPDANEWVGHNRQWFDLIHLAVQTDSTRVIVHRIPEQLAAPTAPGTRIGEHAGSLSEQHGRRLGPCLEQPARVARWRRVQAPRPHRLRPAEKSPALKPLRPPAAANGLTVRTLRLQHGRAFGTRLMPWCS